MYMYQLEDRVFDFAKQVRLFVRNQDGLFQNDVNQVLRSSGSVGANYLEANETNTKKDFRHRLSIAKREAKETIYWLKLLNADESLIKEAKEIMHILGSIYQKSR